MRVPLSSCVGGSNRVRVPLARANAYDLHEINDKDFSVTNLAGLGRVGNRFDYPVGHGIFDGNFNLCFGYELDGIFGAPLNFGVPALPTKAAHFSDGDALHAYLADRFANVI